MVAKTSWHIDMEGSYVTVTTAEKLERLLGRVDGDFLPFSFIAFEFSALTLVYNCVYIWLSYIVYYVRQEVRKSMRSVKIE